MNVADILDKAADLIEPEGAWIRHRYAVDAHGEPTVPTDPSAVCWCAMGAIYRVSECDGAIEDECRELLAGIVGHRGFGSWNDTHTQAEVVAKLREAAAKARDQGS